jgi:thiopeptide-type bacteriocin biosynthesis protein
MLSAEGQWKVVDYMPEPVRFGGAEALPWAEEHFHISSRVALDRINRDNYVYGDTLFDAMRLHVSAAYVAGLSVDHSSTYFDSLCNQWIGAFFSPADDAMDAALLQKEVRADFENTLAPQFAFLQDALRQMYLALQDQKFDTKQPEWLRWFRGNELIFKELGNNLEKALPSLLHLTNNRLGVNNQDEAYLLFVLGRVLS